MKRVLIVAACAACGARTGLAVLGAGDASVDVGAPHDASTESGHDAGVDAFEASVPDVAPPCDYGTLVSDVFGATVEWNGGAPVPAGHYRITYVDGCMKYSSGQAWTVNAYANGPDTLYVVADGVPLAPAPGTVGFQQGQGAFASFDECVAANQSDAPLEIDFDGGTLGLQLDDFPYTDNVEGESGRNPTYRLSSCP